MQHHFDSEFRFMRKITAASIEKGRTPKFTAVLDWHWCQKHNTRHEQLALISRVMQDICHNLDHGHRRTCIENKRAYGALLCDLIANGLENFNLARRHASVGITMKVHILYIGTGIDRNHTLNLVRLLNNIKTAARLVFTSTNDETNCVLLINQIQALIYDSINDALIDCASSGVNIAISIVGDFWSNYLLVVIPSISPTHSSYDNSERRNGFLLASNGIR
mmetsp:Transcript_16078/g.29062  ORF Transcript_16078/g.29062 Transcript_16078/m.29062 type:complete len:221 (+) Transcript_16078:754-1416(+)